MSSQNPDIDDGFMNGGKIIDKGSYSCIFMPELRCKPNTTRTLSGNPIVSSDAEVKNPKLSKLIDTSSAIVEFNISKHISTIPLWKNYFAISESICHPAPRQTDLDLSTCDSVDDLPLSQLRILSMTYRGDSLYTHRFNMNTFQFPSFMKHMLEAGSLMAIFGLVHRDLHLGNYLVDSYDIPRIIDFNLSITTHQRVSASFLSHAYDPQILQESPDSTLINAISHGYSYDRIIPAIIKKKNILRKLQTFFRISPMTMERELFDFYKQSKSAKKGDTESWFHSYWSTIDSWAIGVMLVDMILKFMNWKRFTETYQEHKQRIESILRKMCEINPMKRINCVQALQMFDPQNFILRKYGNAWLSRTESI